MHLEPVKSRKQRREDSRCTWNQSSQRNRVEEAVGTPNRAPSKFSRCTWNQSSQGNRGEEAVDSVGALGTSQAKETEERRQSVHRTEHRTSSDQPNLIPNGWLSSVIFF
ncbi:unnamed protein product [Ilex paraguariensis]|uniref:Uncharacterized protein n=1 Tax=Ilex paraguariensis TaxID=185542 RepID=A0ABC8TUR9_9AQUA